MPRSLNCQALCTKVSIFSITKNMMLDFVKMQETLSWDLSNISLIPTLTNCMDHTGSFMFCFRKTNFVVIQLYILFSDTQTMLVYDSWSILEHFFCLSRLCIN